MDAKKAAWISGWRGIGVALITSSTVCIYSSIFISTDQVRERDVMLVELVYDKRNVEGLEGPEKLFWPS